MRIDCCDVCLSEGRITTTFRYIRWRLSGAKVYVCDAHSKAVKKWAPEQAVACVRKAEDIMLGGNLTYTLVEKKG